MNKYTEKYILDYFSKGGLLIVCDDEDREDEGDLVIGAQFMTPEIMNFIIKNTGGYVCLPMTEELAFNMNLSYMCNKNNDPNKTNFTITVDSVDAITGVSAEDRSTTSLELCKENPKIRSPGHINPLIANNGLFANRQGHTEASIFLCIASNIKPVSVIAECTNDDGTMMRYPQ